MEYKILIVDDEPDILEFVGYNLRKAGYRVTVASNGDDAVARALETVPDLILLDVMMPRLDGLETCRIIRSHPLLSKTYIAFLSARGEDYSQISGFEAGADDYIAKPIRIDVLLHRVAALLRRREGTVVPDGISIDRDKHTVSVDGQEIALPRKEFGIMELLMSRPGKVFSREEIFAAVWGTDVIVGDRTIDVHIRKLREKLGDRYIATLKGVGYKFEG